MESCFFLHNPKAGGTAIREQLAQRFGPAETAPILDLVPDVYRRNPPPALPPGYRYYAGHYGYDHYRALGVAHPLITNFRHPAPRILSLYNYFRYSVAETAEVREAPEYHAVRLARSAGFDDFVASDDPRVATYVQDYHFRQLAGSGWSLEADASIAEVCELIDRLDWYYVCEHPLLSVLWGREALGIPSLAIPRANVTPGGGDLTAGLLGLSEASLSTLMKRNRRDLKIYAHALSRFFRVTADLMLRPREDEAGASAPHASGSPPGWPGLAVAA